MIDQIKFHQVLQQSFEAICKKNSQYTMRSFARKIGIAPSTLSDFINGRKCLSAKKIYSISLKLSLSNAVREDLNKYIFNSHELKDSNKYQVCPDLSGRYVNYFGNTRHNYEIEHRGFLSMKINLIIEKKKLTTFYMLDGVLKRFRDFEDYKVYTSMYATSNEIVGQKIMVQPSSENFFTVPATFCLDKHHNIIYTQRTFDAEGTLVKNHVALLTNVENGEPEQKYELYRPVP